jgi:predicted aspartyl protease
MRVRARFGFICLLASLTACMKAPDPVKQTACTVDRVAEMPVRVVDGAILVPGQIDQAPVQMQIDTGATSSMMDETTAARLALPSDAHRRTTLHGIGGQVQTQNTLVESLKIGGQEWQSLSLATGHLATAFHESIPVAGLLGADRLAVFDIELDVPHGRMTLWTVAHCAGDFALQGVPHYAVPLAWHSPNRLVARVEVDGHPVEALIDWGAKSTTITETAATAIGITPAMLAGDRSGTNWGIDRNEAVVRSSRRCGSAGRRFTMSV